MLSTLRPACSVLGGGINLVCQQKIGFSSSQKKYSPTMKFPRAADLVAVAPKSFQPYLQIMRADKPIGTWLLYWPCTWSIALASQAGQLPSLYLLSLFGAGAFLMRSAGCVINDLWDKDFDKRVERTKLRPLACGSMNEKQAVVLLGGLLTASLGILMQLNWFSVAVGASSMLLVVGYPLAKRYTYWPQFILGATLNWGVIISWAHLAPPNQFCQVLPLYFSAVLYTVIYDTIYGHMVRKRAARFGVVYLCLTFNWGALLGWAAATGSLSLAPICLYLAALQWTLSYDTIYAHMDKADDILIGVKSTALRFGDDTKKWLSGFGAATVAGFGMAGYIADQTWPFYAALAGTAAHLSWQIATLRINDTEDCLRKFRSNSWMGALLFAGIVMGNLLKDSEEDLSQNDA